MPLHILIALGLSIYQGILSMGFQLVGSRLLYPYFGSSIIVWAFLISTFLAAFTSGSIAGGVFSKFLPARKNRVLVWLAVLCSGGFFVPAYFGKTMLMFLSENFHQIEAGLLLSCLMLFFVPIVALSAFPPLLADSLDKKVFSTGLASGMIYGFSTLGNIIGVMGTVFVLIPNVPISLLLKGWFVVSSVLGGLLLASLLERGRV
jgi:hypothetical protein